VQPSFSLQGFSQAKKRLVKLFKNYFITALKESNFLGFTKIGFNFINDIFIFYIDKSFSILLKCLSMFL